MAVIVIRVNTFIDVCLERWFDGFMVAYLTKY